MMAAAFLAVAVLVTAFGGWQLFVLFAAIGAARPVIDVDSALFALPPFGSALAALGILLGLPAKGKRHPRLAVMLFSGFLVLGAIAVAALMLGPALTSRVMVASGYRGCATQIGIRTEQVRWVATNRPCARPAAS